VYGRYGTRSHRTQWEGDVALEGLAKALQAALDLHKGYPANADRLKNKKDRRVAYERPEQIPSLAAKFGPKLNYEGDVVRSCIHCHQIGDAFHDLSRKNGQSFADEMLFPYPHPKSIGFVLDPKTCATILSVKEKSPAAEAGFQAGDQILTLNEQPLVSIADFQWVLHNTPQKGWLMKAEILRAGQPLTIPWKLEKNWRQADDISWRASTWGLRRMALGGMILEADEQNPGKLRVRGVGQFGLNAHAHNLGIRKGDQLVSYDGITTFQRETDVIRHALQSRDVGAKIPVVIRRDGKELKFNILTLE
jgi:serine protease Do